jgi:hypothetical protein
MKFLSHYNKGNTQNLGKVSGMNSLYKVDPVEELSARGRRSLRAICETSERQMIGFTLQGDGDFGTAYDMGPRSDGSSPHERGSFR